MSSFEQDPTQSAEPAKTDGVDLSVCPDHLPDTRRRFQYKRGGQVHHSMGTICG
jgi:hypothetical protein